MLKSFVSINAWIHYQGQITFSSYSNVESFLTAEDVSSIKKHFSNCKPNKVEPSDKVWFAKGAITRDKMSLVTDELKIKRVRKIDEADKVVIDDSVLSTIVDDSRLTHYIMAPTNLIKAKINNTKWDSYTNDYLGDKVIIYSSNDLKKTKDHLTELIGTDNDFSKCKIESYYEVRGVHRTMGWGDGRYITTNEKVNDLFNSIEVSTKNNNGILMSEFFRVADADNAALDFETYETIAAMVGSRDAGNALMGLEVLSNCLVPEGNEALIALVFKKYYHVHGPNKSKFTPSIWSFIKRNKQVHDLANNNYRYLIPKLMKLNNSDDMKKMIQDMFIEEVNRNYFKGESIQVANISFNI